ncbi:MAG: hypothetical protein ACRCTF_03395 [Bacteroidales bacterium]
MLNREYRQFRCGKKEGLVFNIDCLIRILSNNNHIISAIDINNIELGLLYLLSYTLIDNSDTEDDVIYKITIKVKVAEFIVYYKNLNTSSEACAEWERVFCDENEFLEISNQYKAVISNHLD